MLPLLLISYFSLVHEMLGGHTDVDLIFPFFKSASPFGQVVLSCPCDLECYDFDSFFTRPCRWRNEPTGCTGDELEWTRMRGAWGPDGDSAFFTTDRPDGFFMIAGIQQKLSEFQSAMFVSDPIQCQEGDGVLRFRHWTSPGVKIRVCVRPPSAGKHYSWCSGEVKRKAGKLAKVVIPGTLWSMFEIVIEAYDFTFDAFGVQGGAAVIDDISYNASAIYECKLIPHFDPPEYLSNDVCEAVQCNFDSGSCLKHLPSKWEVVDEQVGPQTTGVNMPLEESFAFVTGPGSPHLELGPFITNRTVGLHFCYYLASYESDLEVLMKDTDDNEVEIFTTPPMNRFSRNWNCKMLPVVGNGTIVFQVNNLRNEFAYFGLDQIELIDPLTGLSACSEPL